MPGRDDARRVAPEHAHVREAHTPGTLAEGLSQELQVGLARGHEHRPLPLERPVDQRQRSREELIGPGIEERFVAKVAATAVPAGCPAARVRRDRGGRARALEQRVYPGHRRGLAAIIDDVAVVALLRLSCKTLRSA